MMTKNRYINATRLCNENKRRFDNWLRNESNKQLINFVNNKLDYNSIIIIKGGNNQLICGTYVHELLIENIIKWMQAPINKQPEYYISNKLNQNLNGRLEVNTLCGKIDILTDLEIIEVKEYRLWKSALGQILAYSYFYPDKQKRIHLFGVSENTNIELIENIFKNYDIILKINFNLIL
jgi:hypothetical protein